MAGWTTVDDFETGDYGIGWSGDKVVLPVVATTTLEGDYAVTIDTDAVDYATNTDFIVLNNQSVSRNSDGDDTVRTLLYNKYSYKGSKPSSLIFLATDSSNFYVLKLSTDYSTNSQKATLSKYVSDTETELATYNWDDEGATVFKGIKITVATSLITVSFYEDKTFTTADATTLTSDDTTYTTGKVGYLINNSDVADQGTQEAEFLCDYLQYYDAGTSGTNMKINIGDTFKDVDSMKINIGDSWKDVNSASVNVGDSWKTVF